MEIKFCCFYIFNGFPFQYLKKSKIKKTGARSPQLVLDVSSENFIYVPSLSFSLKDYKTSAVCGMK